MNSTLDATTDWYAARRRHRRLVWSIVLGAGAASIGVCLAALYLPFAQYRTVEVRASDQMGIVTAGEVISRGELNESLYPDAESWEKRLYYDGTQATLYRYIPTNSEKPLVVRCWRFTNFPAERRAALVAECRASLGKQWPSTLQVVGVKTQHPMGSVDSEVWQCRLSDGESVVGGVSLASDNESIRLVEVCYASFFAVEAIVTDGAW